MAKIKPRIRTHADGATSWHVVIETTRDPATGKRRQQRITARTKRECEQRATAELAKVQRGEYVPPCNLTVEEYLSQWLDGLGPPLRASTINVYGVVVRRLLPVLGTIKLENLTSLDVRSLHRRLTEAGYATSTIQTTHVVLHKALNQAVGWRMVARNVADGVSAPAPEPKLASVWSVDQARRLADQSADDRFSVVWLLALDTGLRLGEALALRWGDVDLDRATLAVQRTLTKDRDGRWSIGDSPKSKSGRRPVALSPASVAMLRAHRVTQVEERLASGRPDHDLVFCRADGTFLRPRTVSRAFVAACERAGVPPITFHGLRHSHATHGLEAGVHPLVMSKRLGHRSVAVTLDLYSHVSDELQHDAAARIRAFVDGPGDTAVAVSDDDGQETA